jgi:hypothetical protein
MVYRGLKPAATPAKRVFPQPVKAPGIFSTAERAKAEALAYLEEKSNGKGLVSFEL